MLINFLFLIITILILIFQKINLQDDKYLVSRNNIEIEKKNELCNIVKYTSSTLPENIKCNLKKNLIYILKFLKKDKEFYISGNEITNVQIIENKFYKKIIVDIFVWDLKKIHYNFIKFNYSLMNNRIIIHSINFINDKNRNSDVNKSNLKFIKNNEYLENSKIRNKWII